MVMLYDTVDNLSMTLEEDPNGVNKQNTPQKLSGLIFLQKHFLAFSIW